MNTQQEYKIFWKNGFYNTKFNVQPPEDAIEISEELYNSLLAGNAQGKNIVTNSKTGLPELKDAVIPLATKEDLSEFLYNKKCSVAYTYLSIEKAGKTYKFETDKDSIAMCQAQISVFSMNASLSSVNWKVYENNFPTTLELTKEEFMQIFTKGMEVMNEAFAVEGQLNNQLKDAKITSKFVEEFKATATEMFEQIDKTLSL